ncbi:MAG: DUF4359 domain-containing protein [Calothrix sp. C42_A2020_038]|nr:DUF4359 domain-containing protein [Calothrix sp. C42_A2020_038]
MKSAIITGVGVVGLCFLAAAMVKSNPNEAAYQEYAVQELSNYLKSNVCKKSLGILEKLINNRCDKIVDTASPQMHDIIAASTVRHDFVIFSVYHTELKISDWVPSYKFETVGAFDRFYTYNAQQN